MTEQQAMQMALEALETLMLERGSIYDKAITALRQALEQQPATWVGLTDEEIQEIALELPMDAVRIAEAKLKEKNT